MVVPLRGLSSRKVSKNFFTDSCHCFSPLAGIKFAESPLFCGGNSGSPKSLVSVPLRGLSSRKAKLQNYIEAYQEMFQSPCGD